jgi:hypothetical protein
VDSVSGDTAALPVITTPYHFFSVSQSSGSEMNFHFSRSQRNIEMVSRRSGCLYAAVHGLSEICDDDDIRGFFAGMF